MILTEHQEQVKVVDWLRLNHPDLRFFAIPNGGHRNKITAAILKAEGVSSGVPDLFIPKLNLFVEMKRLKRGSVSKSQREWIGYLIKYGYDVSVCRGHEAAIETISQSVTQANRDRGKE